MDKAEKNNLLEESVLYFKARPVYQKLFMKMRDKYAGLGHVGGTLILTALSREEKNQLSGFFQKDYTANKTVTISAKLLEKCLESSKFSELTWEMILEAYFGEPLEVRKEIERTEAERREMYFAEIIDGVSEQKGKEWLKSVLAERKEGYSLFMQLYKESPEMLRDIIKYVTVGIAELQILQSRNKKELLPVFSAKVTGNPHYFDEGKSGEKLLFSYLRDNDYNVEQEALSKVEYKNRVYYEAGILKDEVSNDVLVYGIHGWKTGERLHEGIEGFLQNQEPVKLTLQTIGNLEKVCGQSRQVYVVDNPAVLVLMDKFTEESMFWYAGDFDPEGLLIARRLKLRYKKQLELWKYHVDLYEKYLSEVELSDRRIKELERIHIKELQEMKEMMYKKRWAVYQETIINELR